MIDTVVKQTDLFSVWSGSPPSASRGRRPVLPFGKPCLLMTREFDENGDYDGDSVKLWDLTRGGDELSRRALIWGAEGQQRWVGGKDDWLATVDNDSGDARLVNPYAGCQIDLPPPFPQTTTTVTADGAPFSASATTRCSSGPTTRSWLPSTSRRTHQIIAGVGRTAFVSHTTTYCGAKVRKPTWTFSTWGLRENLPAIQALR